MKTLHFLCIIIILFASCTPSYIPNLSNVPLLEEEGEININANIATSGFDPQLSYALTDRFALMVNGSFYKEEEEKDFHVHRYGEMALGTYKAHSKAFKLEVFGGFGAGKLKTEHEESPLLGPQRVDAFTNKMFLQPNVGFRTDVLDFALANRFSLINIINNDNDSSIAHLEPFWEPSLTLKIGYKTIKGYSQIGISVPLSNEIDFEYLPFFMGIGIQLNIK